MNEANFIVALDNDLERIGLQHLIQEKLTESLVLSATNLHEVHKYLFEKEQAVVIISSDMLELEGITPTVALAKCFTKSKWLVLAETTDELFLTEIINIFQETGIVLNHNKQDEILKAVAETLAGRKYYCTEAEAILNEIRNRKKESSSKRSLLTSTELELVQLITQGKTAKEIADLRCLSYHTVNTHRKNIFRKLEIGNVQELIKYALRNGLVDLTEYYI